MWEIINKNGINNKPINKNFFYKTLTLIMTQNLH